MPGQYVIVRDSFNRLRAEVTDSFAVGIKLLAEDHPRRVEQNVHAYVVADIATELGPWRIRDIRIMWSPENKRHFIRYRQWKTGKVRDQRDEWLDVAGPLDRDTRSKVQEAILAVFAQIKEEAQQGTLGRRVPAGTGTIGDNPEVAAKLETLKGDLEATEAADIAGQLDADPVKVTEVEMSPAIVPANDLGATEAAE
jgi:DNA-binding cell septation regulator SpoVG